MTICIAALSRAEDEPSIVVAYDFMVSTGAFSQETGALKITRFGRDWYAMLAGDDISPCEPILSHVAKILAGSDQYTLDQMVSAFTHAFQLELKAERERRVLGTYSLDLDEFVQNGLQMFGESSFNHMCSQIENICFDIEFLVCGFSPNGKAPHLFSISGRDLRGRPQVEVRFHGRVGFHAIGSGAFSATSMLFCLEQRLICPPARTFYNVCAAKFMAETATGVGRDAWVQVMRPGGEMKIYMDEPLKMMRDIWESGGKPRFPKGAQDTVLKALSLSHESSENQDSSGSER